MCGIAGIRALGNWQNESDCLNEVGRMCDAIAHRGPDSSGTWYNKDCETALGHRRLSIIDLSSDGNQPMIFNDEGLVITYNGEIYNYKELKFELESEGIKIRTKTDTEVLVKAINLWGLRKSLQKCIGMFAFALLDLENRELHLARDRAGKKPLYYYRYSNSICFASEIKAIATVRNTKLEINEAAISHFLSLGYIPHPFTIYKDLVEVPPGSICTVRSDLNIEIEKYWELGCEYSKKPNSEDVVTHVENLLSDSVRLRLRSDVEVGSFLSGGIDSGLITALAAKHSERPLQTFTAKFSDGPFNEAPYAKMVAERYGTIHNELEIRPDLDEILPKIIRSYDEPFGDPSVIPTYAISREASKYVKVVLNGEGSDELFGGYRRHKAIEILKRFNYLLKPIQPLVGPALKVLPKPRNFRSKYSLLYRFMRASGLEEYQRFIDWTSDGFSEIEKRKLLTDIDTITSSKILNEGHYNFDRISDSVGKFMALDFVSGMGDCLLVKMDIATMAHGLEARCPFLDNHLVDYATSLDRRLITGGKVSKPILRKLAEKYLPYEIANMPKKGFEIPLIEWVKYDLREHISDICLSRNGIMNDLFRREELISVIENRGRMEDERWAKRVWHLFMLAAWQKYR